MRFLFFLVCGLGISLASGGGPVVLPANPLIRGADPHVEWIDGTFWIYGTGLREGGGRFYAASSPDLRDWQYHGPLVDLNELAWPRADGRERVFAWAPCVAERDGKWYFYFSVGPQCARFRAHIGVASGDSPGGPFRDSGKPLLTGGQGFEAIDPMVWHDPAGERWLLYAGGSAGAKLRVFELGDDMMSLARELPVETPQKFTEGAFMHWHDGLYHFTYSHGRWQYPDYSVHHATAPGPTGPWTYRGAILESGRRHKGPGHHSIIQVPDSGQWLIFYHRWQDARGDGPYRGARQIAAAPLVHLPGGAIRPVTVDD